MARTYTFKQLGNKKSEKRQISYDKRERMSRSEMLAKLPELTEY